MSVETTVLLGAIAGFTIFLGLPVARLRNLSRATQGFLNALATGVLVFLLWDVLSKANEPIEDALKKLRGGDAAASDAFVTFLALFVGGIALGLLSLAVFNHRLARGRPGRAPLAGDAPGAAIATSPAFALPSGRALALMIAVGLGLHNFSEGLAIGQAASSGEISFALVLVIGFGLHNITEGFGIAAPLAASDERPSWGFLFLAGLIAGGPTFLGTVIGRSVESPYAFVLFLALAAGALIYLIGEMSNVGRKLNSPTALGWGVLLGFLAGYGTDLFLTFAGG